jgi:hypothetical protein
VWAKAALDRDRAPIIFAASANNRAVTNIIDAFGADVSEGEGPFAGRWLPDLTSFASYFPARNRSVSQTYLTQEFFDRVEDADYLAGARSAFLGAAAIAFPDLEDRSVETVVERLHGQLRAQADALAEIESSWSALVLTRERGHAVLGNNPEAEAERRRSVRPKRQKKRARAHKSLASHGINISPESHCCRCSSAGCRQSQGSAWAEREPLYAPIG